MLRPNTAPALLDPGELRVRAGAAQQQRQTEDSNATGQKATINNSDDNTTTTTTTATKNNNNNSDDSNDSNDSNAPASAARSSSRGGASPHGTPGGLVGSGQPTKATACAPARADPASASCASAAARRPYPSASTQPPARAGPRPRPAGDPGEVRTTCWGEDRRLARGLATQGRRGAGTAAPGAGKSPARRRRVLPGTTLRPADLEAPHVAARSATRRGGGSAPTCRGATAPPRRPLPRGLPLLRPGLDGPRLHERQRAPHHRRRQPDRRGDPGRRRHEHRVGSTYFSNSPIAALGRLHRRGRGARDGRLRTIAAPRGRGTLGRPPAASTRWRWRSRARTSLRRRRLGPHGSTSRSAHRGDPVGPPPEAALARLAAIQAALSRPTGGKQGSSLATPWRGHPPGTASPGPRTWRPARSSPRSGVAGWPGPRPGPPRSGQGRARPRRAQRRILLAVGKHDEFDLSRPTLAFSNALASATASTTPRSSATAHGRGRPAAWPPGCASSPRGSRSHRATPQLH